MVRDGMVRTGSWQTAAASELERRVAYALIERVERPGGARRRRVPDGRVEDAVGRGVDHGLLGHRDQPHADAVLPGLARVDAGARRPGEHVGAIGLGAT